MTNAPQQSMPQQVAPSNGLGTAGFVTSLVGWVTCGALCPIGLVLSLVALTKEPRGMAIAGVVIGGIGSLFLFLAGIAIIGAMAAAIGIGVAATGPLMETATLYHARQQIESVWNETGELPSEEAGNQAIVDGGMRFNEQYPVYEILEGGAYRITTAGRDGEFGTQDDISETFRAGQDRQAPQPAGGTGDGSSEDGGN